MWNIYPRPQLARNSFFNLNGEWAFSENGDTKETINVPFVPQSELSGIGRAIPETSTVSYKRTFSLPEDFLPEGYFLLINFGAVDQRCKVYLNGNLIGVHENGYTSFSCRVNPAQLSEVNTLEVYVTDTISDQIYPRGKQHHKPHDMWYTPCTGIWQTVWAEAVPPVYISNIKIDTTLDSAVIRVFCRDTATGGIVSDLSGRIEVSDTPNAGDTQLIGFDEGRCEIHFDNPRNWTPEDPYLYRFTLRVGDDRVDSYLGLRTISMGRVKGIPRILLNGKPYFFHGVLDQGYFQDGIFTPESPDGYKNDIQTMKDMGFNTLRKHIKVEPDYFYYLCDSMGMVVFQDMVNNGQYNYIRDTIMPTFRLNKHRSDKNLNKNPRVRKTFLKCSKATIRQLYNHPSICYWTIFNEGWGQFCGDEVYKIFKKWDSSRIIDTASGWYICENTDISSPHIYFHKGILSRASKPIVITEYGGYSFNDTSQNDRDPKKAYGYRDFNSREEYENAILDLFKTQVLDFIPVGLCGDIYTQLSDVEDEINGLVTYNRKSLKVDPQRFKEMGDRIIRSINIEE